MSADGEVVGEYLYLDMYYEDIVGAFTFKDGSWIEVKKLVADDADNGDQFGVSVTLSGSTQVAGASFADSGGVDTGAVYIFP
jgi:hypothetical protein